MVYEFKVSDEATQNPGGSQAFHVSDDIQVDGNSKSHLLENRDWSWSHMERQLKERNLETLYARYRQILHQGYFSVFLLLQLLLTAIHVGLLLVTEVDDPQHRTMPDVIAYIAIALLLWPLVTIVFNKSLVKKYPSLPHVVSCFAVAIVVFVDIGLPIYHTSMFHSRIPLRPAYTTHALLACYIFLPLSNYLTPFALGVGITISHMLTLMLVTYRHSGIPNKQIMSEIVFFVCVNGMGLSYRLIKEMIIRRAFLDRRACVEFTTKLNYEKEQEEQLLLSILPWHIATRVREDIRKKSLQLNHLGKPITTKPFKELYIEKHDNVSILYADVVNYTKMTSSLPVNKLVETLNELFGKFDEASERHKVLRIKFLGDCYYCASGIPQPNPDHAKSCVDLGLDMISIISEVRRQRKLDIDMRIGVHSGSILSGLLGRCKWQYDIWSKDVAIANRMEQCGKPGMVHVTKQTLDLLGDNYIVEPGNGHLRDRMLAKNGITTFLIRPHQEEKVSSKFRFSKFEKRESIIPGKFKTKNAYSRHGSDIMYSLRGVISGEGNMALSRRRTAFMNNNLIMYQQRLKMADVYMEKAIDNLPARKCSFWLHNSRLYPLCLTFRDECKWELPFLKQPDPLFKFSIIVALFVSICICLMHFWQPPRLYLISWISFGISIVGLVCLIPLTWCHYVWNAVKDPNHQMRDVQQPGNKFLRFLYKSSTVQVYSILEIYNNNSDSNVTSHRARDDTSEANGLWVSLQGPEFMRSRLCESKYMLALAQYQNEMAKMFQDLISFKQMTESCYLAVLMSFFFTRIHFQLKLLVGICILVVYSSGVMMVNTEFRQETWNPHLDPKIANILSIVFLILELHFTDRQAECMDRLDYLWKRQLCTEKDEAEKTRSVNLMLLHNILPIHVASVYLNTNRASNDLYHENYDCIAVMFASLVNYDLYTEKNTDQSDIKGLEILNKIICDFDDALYESRFKTVEKIKVAGSTYMAACGLHPGQKESSNADGVSSTKVVLTLIEFAATVFRRLQLINKEFNTDFKLRIGISHGPVTAGVVGSQKPLYDIWGNAVNVASRMDSTGQPNKIQVTTSTAVILQQEGVPCTFRGPIHVKGKGILDTYFVDLTDNWIYLTRMKFK
ncbi:hypothetical protein RUM43_002929 [Polyplax serrata]|uniref:adenylate cyclase n=1 Tax=Polyplax serrata TaxID=468196 RepID=A0AAN8PN03_POLSC